MTSDCYRWPRVRYENERPFAYSDGYGLLHSLLPAQAGMYHWVTHRSPEDEPNQQYVYIGETQDLASGLEGFFEPQNRRGKRTGHHKCYHFFHEKQAEGFTVHLRLLDLDRLTVDKQTFTGADLADRRGRKTLREEFVRRAKNRGYIVLDSKYFDKLAYQEDTEPGTKERRTNYGDKQYVYALLDPVTYRVYYVGRSKHPMKRYWSHVTSQEHHNQQVYRWVRTLHRQYDQRPRTVLLDRIPSFAQPRMVEVWWICKFIELGHPVMNVNDTQWTDAEWGAWQDMRLCRSSFEKPDPYLDDKIRSMIRSAKVPRYWSKE